MPVAQQSALDSVTRSFSRNARVNSASLISAKQTAALLRIARPHPEQHFPAQRLQRPKL
jgi:hypothetical protein